MSSNIKSIEKLYSFFLGSTEIRASGSFGDYLRDSQSLYVAICESFSEKIICQFGNSEMCTVEFTGLSQIMSKWANIDLGMNNPEPIIKMITLSIEGDDQPDLNVNYFEEEVDGGIMEYSPCIFYKKISLDDLQGIYINLDYMEIMYDGDKFFNLEDLMSALHGGIGDIFGLRR